MNENTTPDRTFGTVEHGDITFNPAADTRVADRLMLDELKVIHDDLWPETDDEDLLVRYNKELDRSAAIGFNYDPDAEVYILTGMEQRDIDEWKSFVFWEVVEDMDREPVKIEQL